MYSRSAFWNEQWKNNQLKFPKWIILVHKRFHRYMRCTRNNLLRDDHCIMIPLWHWLVEWRCWRKRIGRLRDVSELVFWWGSRTVRPSGRRVPGTFSCRAHRYAILGPFRRSPGPCRDTSFGFSRPQSSFSRKRCLLCTGTSWCKCVARNLTKRKSTIDDPTNGNGL